ncbi:MAG TPA: hypothetical protein DD827_02600 [Gammaproteobacteria bacterium]|nr:hypothetical protein [Gammaproteobacteria bacterium]
MSQQPNILLINEFGIYPELIAALREAGYPITIEHLMRKAIKHVKKQTPDIVIAEFAHEGAFRDRVSNLESMLAQVEGGAGKTRTIVFYAAERRQYLDRVLEVFKIDICLQQPVTGEQLIEAVKSQQ